MTTTNFAKILTQISFSIQSSFTPLSTQRLFRVWQDLANTATGHDTEWDYPIAINRIAQELGITEDYLIQQLIQENVPASEFLPENATLTFHYPV